MGENAVRVAKRSLIVVEVAPIRKTPKMPRAESSNPMQAKPDIAVLLRGSKPSSGGL